MDKMGIMKLLKNFTAADFNSKSGRRCNLTWPFVQGDKVIATNGHVMIMVDKEVEPELYETVRTGKFDGELPPALEALADYTKYKRNRPFRQSELDALKIKHNFPYEMLRSTWPETRNEERNCLYDCPICIIKKIPFDEGFHIDLAYLLLMELIMLYFGGNWTVWFPDDIKEQIVFTNGGVVYVVMPMAAD